MAQDRMRQMQKQMEDMQNRPAATNQRQAQKAVDGDYIEYEEVK